MKKPILIFLLAFMALSCKEDKKAEDVKTAETDSEVIEISGSFMYYDHAAVFQTPHELYGVVSNEMLDELILQSEMLKQEPSDEVAVTLKVKTSKKPEHEEGWENRIEIIDILKVSQVPPGESDIIKLGTGNNAENQ